MEIREDDVYIATFMKSGTHWMWEIVSMLLKGVAKYEEAVMETTMLQFISMEEAEKLPSPRVLNCHYPVHLIPDGVIKKGCKIVHVRRNVKDIIVSHFNHHNGFSKKGDRAPITIDDLLDLYLGDHGFYLNYSWCKYVQQWENLGKERPEQVLNINFEDMKKDLKTEITKVSKFLGLDSSADLVTAIAEKCTFQNLKQANKDVKKDPREKKVGANDFIYRRGEVGDWKNWLTVPQNERIDKWLEENLKDTELKATFCL